MPKRRQHHGPNRATIKARLANVGANLPTDSELKCVPIPRGDGQTVVVLDRVRGAQPHYLIAGYVSCCVCDEFCLMGTESGPLVWEGKAIGICRECACEVLPADSQPIMRVEDR